MPHGHWTLSIPRALRGLFERSLLSLLSQTAYAFAPGREFQQLSSSRISGNGESCVGLSKASAAPVPPNTIKGGGQNER